MNSHSKRAFYYHAHASSLGGTLRQPLERVVSTNAATSLAAAGGFSSSREQRFHLDGLISFDAAHVRVSGSEHVHHAIGEKGKESRSWRTLSAATIEKLNILEVLTADRVVAQVSVDHPQNEDEEDGNPTRVALLGSRFENLRIHGVPVHPKLDPRAFGVGREKDLRTSAVDKMPLQFHELVTLAGKQHTERDGAAHSHLKARLVKNHPDTDVSTKGSALCSLVKHVGLDQEAERAAAVPEEVSSNIEIFSHMLHIPDFGNVFLGEMLVSRFSVQLTMVRVEMGSMADGDLSACSVFSNGRIMP